MGAIRKLSKSERERERERGGGGGEGGRQRNIESDIKTTNLPTQRDK